MKMQRGERNRAEESANGMIGGGGVEEGTEGKKKQRGGRSRSKCEERGNRETHI
jgi:hypothetical protein